MSTLKCKKISEITGFYMECFVWNVYMYVLYMESASGIIGYFFK